MKVALDRVLEVGGARVAAISGLRVVPTCLRGGAGVWASKEPLAILVERGGKVEGFAVDGAVLRLDAVEEICPGAVARFAGLDSGA